MRRKTVDIAASALVVLLVAFALAPALARLQRSSAEAQCQSNLRRWSQAMALYLADHQGTYPTNRSTNGGMISASVPLTKDGLTDGSGNPLRFVGGPNWVEALYPYLWTAAARTSEDWKSFRACPNASAAKFFGPYAYVTYTFNFYLVEFRSSLLRTPASLMMLREVDRHVTSICRPSTTPADGGGASPLDPFLTGTDAMMGKTNPNLHGSGSYIAFADGHVHYFTTDYFSATGEYDNNEQRWYNFMASPNPALYESIAISP